MTNKQTKQGWNVDNSYASLPNALFSTIKLNPVQSPKLLIINDSLSEFLGLDSEALQRNEGVDILAGNQVPEGSVPIAQAYAGHQFGNFTMLGDGRAVLLGEQITPQGKRFDIQLKGSGRTPYSRGGDGRAAFGPMLREYIMSEAMHALGIATTRSLAVVTTGESVFRETELPGAILTRVASSHIRVGTFQYVSARGDIDDLRAFANYTINRHFPDLEAEENRYLALLNGVIKRQAKLISKWQLVGFIHGVMNTDNMTISGETIDYGPCAFMDKYDPKTVFSSIDREGRYSYGNQPYIGGWNLARFAESLLPLLHEEKEKALNLAQEAISGYSKQYQQDWLSGMRAKLGLFNVEDQDEELIESLLSLMQKAQADFTNTFHALTLNQIEGTGLSCQREFNDWFDRWQARLGRQQESDSDSKQLMQKSNPVVIPRNHKVEEALAAAVDNNNLSLMERLLQVLSNPYDYAKKNDEYMKPAEPTDRPYQTFCGT
ncbi:protein adenylyltransferase SelO [Halalkalibacter krulwichiae]|uniref:Protein nucleotidyltransferase YdiU n=1 Tax=Halalkalibacter krulwichiae TaxID=199441 RepID=A0A1X9M5Y4_9BACI|nr:YdiU family protein [Halalkalibacter krulwichiae]ARK28856.1 hypothetical protein BkAM31D_02730 [Halalkalibacter krulwichiae]